MLGLTAVCPGKHRPRSRVHSEHGARIGLGPRRFSTATAQPPEDLFIEDDTAGGTSPNAPFRGNPTAPSVSSGTLAGPALGGVKSAAATPELTTVATLTRRGSSVRLNAGIRAACPAVKLRPGCSGDVVIRAKAVRITVSFTVRAGRATTLTTSLSRATVRRFGHTGHLVRGRIIVTITEPNAASTSVSENLRARLPAV